MTVITVNALETMLGGAAAAAKAYIRFEYRMAGEKAAATVDGADVTLARTIEVNIVSGVPEVPIDAPATIEDVTYAHVTVGSKMPGTPVVQMDVIVPASGTPVDVGALVVVDPASFEIVQPGSTVAQMLALKANADAVYSKAVADDRFATAQQGGKADSAYQKPESGVPATDLAEAVRTSLGKADSAYQKPAGGVPGSDLTEAVRASLAKADDAVPNTVEGRTALAASPELGAAIADGASDVQATAEAVVIAQIEAVLRARYAADQEAAAKGIVGGSIVSLTDAMTRDPFETSLGVCTVAAGTPDLVTTPAAHGLAVGDRVRFHTKTGFNGAQGSGTTFYVSSVPSSTTFSVYASGSSGANADLTSTSGSATVMKNPPLAFWAWEVSAGSITGDATGDPSGDDMLICSTPHMLSVGDQVSFGSSTIGGISSDTPYWVKERISDYRFRVAASRALTTAAEITSDGTATLRRAQSRFTHSRWPLIQRHLKTYPASYVGAADTGIIAVGSGTVNSGIPMRRMIVTSRTLGLILFRSGASNLRIYVDGALHRSITEADMSAGGVSSGGLGWYGMTFPDTRPRVIEIYGSDLAAACVASDGDLAAAPTPATVRLAAPGDSFTEGTGASEPAKGFANLAARFGTQIGDIIPMGSGSTGYSADGTRLAWEDHWQDVVTTRPHIVAWFLGINDLNSYIANAGATIAAAETCWDGVGGALGVPQIVFGPWPNNGGSGVAQALRDLDADLQDAASENANVLRYWSPVQDGLTFSLADTTHPDNDGHVECMIYALARIIYTMSSTATA